MKTYSSITKASSRNSLLKTKLFWLIVAIGVIILGLIFPWLISRISAFVLYPFHTTSTWVKSSDGMIPLYLRSREALVKEVEAVRKEQASQSGTQLSIQRLLEENMQLRALTKSSQVSERLVARVLDRPNSLPNDLLQIDQGSDHGVVVGAPVYNGIDGVVGLVIYVTETYSFVDLFTSPGFLSTAYIIGPNVFAPIEGVGGGIARVKLPQGVPIRVGQLVILPGVSSAIYGEIVSIQNEPTQPEQYGYLAPSQGINNLLYVTVGVESILNRESAIFEAEMREKIRQATTINLSNFSTTSSSTLGEAVELSE
ncbi:MAG TPA: rod shape-determining protein MreC [Candidatus Paceibacterota bacterium]|nr:rod shape-determining protein MreC [Candidatus Paceibacterota bacterium]HMO83228.1 rod shape-determining protein MreC [Candidatus Paceibacterota bacterium]